MGAIRWTCAWPLYGTLHAMHCVGDELVDNFCPATYPSLRLHDVHVRRCGRVVGQAVSIARDILQPMQQFADVLTLGQIQLTFYGLL